MITNKRHNFQGLLDLLKSSNIKANFVMLRNPEEGAEQQITPEFVPSLSTYIECESPFDDVFTVISSNDEFSKITMVVPIP